MTLSWVVGCIACGLALGWIGWRIASFVRASEAGTRQALDDWVDATITDFVAKRSGLQAEVIRRTLQGNDDADAREAVDRHLGSASLRLTRRPGGGEVEAEVTVTGKPGGAVLRATQVLHWEDLPEEVRGRFLRGGASVVELPWHPRWAGAP